MLVEYGDIVLDIELRIRVHALMQALEDAALPGVIDITPGIRSLQTAFRSGTGCSLRTPCAGSLDAERALPAMRRSR